jgi:hypothetical protein
LCIFTPTSCFKQIGRDILTEKIQQFVNVYVNTTRVSMCHFKSQVSYRDNISFNFVRLLPFHKTQRAILNLSDSFPQRNCIAARSWIKINKVNDWITVIFPIYILNHDTSTNSVEHSVFQFYIPMSLQFDSNLDILLSNQFTIIFYIYFRLLLSNVLINKIEK